MTAILEIDDVVVDFDGFHALDGLSLWVDEGELRFLIGPNGAGKTTLIDVITAMTRATSGTVKFGLHDITAASEYEIVRRGIGRTFQAPSAFDNLTVADNIDLAEQFRRPLRRLLRRRHGLSATASEVLATIGLGDATERLAGTLSHGQKKWLEIGMLLVQEPKLILLDEPVAGMSAAEREHTGNLMRGILDRCTVIVVEHDMDFLRQYANRVSVLHEGRLLSEGTVAEVQADPIVQEVYLGRSQRGDAAVDR